MTKQPYHDNSLHLHLQGVFTAAESRQACLFVYDMLQDLYNDCAPMYLRNAPCDVTGFSNVNLYNEEGGLNPNYNEEAVAELRAGRMSIDFQHSIHLFQQNRYEACLQILSEDVVNFFEGELTELQLENAIIRSLVTYASRRGITAIRQSGTPSGVWLLEIADAYRRL